MHQSNDAPSIVKLHEAKKRLQHTTYAHGLLKKKVGVLRIRLLSIYKEILKCNENISNSMTQAYIKLAAAKYMNCEFSSVVLENTPNIAQVHVNIKSIDRFTRHLILSCQGPDANQLFGLSHGGHQIAVAKEEFKNIIPLLVHKINLNSDFVRVEENLKTTSRRTNAIEKMLIPCIENTIATMGSALDDISREDGYRLTKVMNKIQKKNEEAKRNRLMEVENFVSRDIFGNVTKNPDLAGKTENSLNDSLLALLDIDLINVSIWTVVSGIFIYICFWITI